MVLSGTVPDPLHHPFPTPLPQPLQGTRPRGSGYELTLLGGFDLRLDGTSLAVPVNLRRLLAFLAVTGRPHRRSTVAAVLWTDITDERANGNLRSLLWRSRRQPATANPADCVDVSRDVVSLGAVHHDVDDMVRTARELLELDARRSTAAADRSERTDPDRLRHAALTSEALTSAALTSAALTSAATFEQDLLPDWDEDWLLFERERLRQLRIHALESLCRRLSVAGRHGEAIDAGQLVVAAEPLRETAHRCLIEAHVAEGNAAEALRQYQRYREVLMDELGIEPSDELRSTIATVRAGGRPAADA